MTMAVDTRGSTKAEEATKDPQTPSTLSTAASSEKGATPSDKNDSPKRNKKNKGKNQVELADETNKNDQQAAGDRGNQQQQAVIDENCPQADPSHPQHAEFKALKSQIEKYMQKAGGGAIENAAQMQRLVQQQVSQTREGKIGQLFLYVRNSGFDKLQKMVEANGGRQDAFPRKEDIRTARDQQGHSFLHWGALGGDEEFCRWMIDDVKVDFDSSTINGQTPLMWASLQGHLSIVRLLLDRGADIRKKDSLGATPLLLCLQHKQKLVFFLLIQRCRDVLDDVDVNGCGAVHWSAYKSEMFFLRFLVYFQADFNTLDGNQMSVLHRAVIGGSYEVCEYLMKQRVNPYLKDKDGQDIIMLAERDRGNPYLATALQRAVKKHADPALQPQANECAVPDETTVGGALKPKSDCKSGGCDHDHGGKAGGIMGELKSIMNDSSFQRYIIPSFYLAAASLALYVHIQYLVLVGGSIAPNLTVAVSLAVPLAIFNFIYMTQTSPGHLEKRPIGRSAVEEFMADVDSDIVSAPELEKKLARLCTECWVLKDLRVKHCSVTNKCVVEFDHYCGWLGTPIGKQNHRQFILLAVWELIAQVLHFALLLNCAISEARHENAENGLWGTMMFMLRNYTILFICAISHVMTIPWVTCLTGYHLRLIWRNMTTNEVMNLHRYEHFWVITETSSENVKKEFRNPFDKGSGWQNWLDFWWYRNRSAFGNGYQTIPMQEVGGTIIGTNQI